MASAAAAADVEAWHGQLLTTMLRVMLVLSSVIAVRNSTAAFNAPLHATVVISAVGVCVLVALACCVRLSYRTRALSLVSLTYLIGVWLLGTVGLSGLAYLVAFPVLSALFLGMKPAIAALSLNAVTLIASAMTGTGYRPLNPQEYESAAWFAISVHVLLAASVAALPAAMLLRRLEDVVENEGKFQTQLRRTESLGALGTLASGVAHDFNNVIAAIFITAEHRAADPDSDGVGDDMSTILTACGRARDVVERMLMLGRPLDPDRRPTSILDAVRDTFPLVRASLPSPVSFATELDVDGLVRLHATEMDRILINLVTNASHALLAADTPSPRIRIGVRRSAPTSGGARRLVLWVEDNGPGIPDHQLPSIFDAYFSTKESREGTGLGLASVRAVVSSLGGEIGVETSNAGTTFTISLPEADDAAQRDDARPPARSDHSIRREVMGT